MITLTAEIRVQGENPSPFRLGVSRLGENMFGEEIDNNEVIDKRKIISLESEIRDRADIDKPSFGLISSGGQLSFRDTNSHFLNYANNGILKGGEQVLIFLNNTVTKNKKQVGEYFSNDWNYDNDNRSVSVSFDDNLEDLQENKLSSVPIQYEEKSLKYFYDIITNGFSNISLSENVSDFLNNYKLKYPFMDSSTLWGGFAKICETIGGRCYKDMNGNVTFNSEFD
jgi:hypothetical protein